MKQSKEFSVIQTLFIFPDNLIDIICEYTVLNYDIKYARKLFKALKAIPNISAIRTQYFTPDTVFLFIIFSLALKALTKADDFDCKAWDKVKGKKSNPNVDAHLDALEMLKLILTGNFLNLEEDKGEWASKNLITYMRNKPSNPLVDVSSLLQIIKAALSLFFKTLIINESFLKIIMTANSLKDYKVDYITYDTRHKLAEADKSVNFFLSTSSLLIRNRCLDYSVEKGYTLALTTSEAETLIEWSNYFYDSASFKKLKSNLIAELDFYQLCQEETTTCCSIFSWKRSNKEKLALPEVDHLRDTIQQSDSQAKLAAAIIACKDNPHLKDFKDTFENLKKLFENFCSNELPFIDSYSYNF